MSDTLYIVPSRGRPKNIERLLAQWSLTHATAELLIVVDPDEPRLVEYLHALDLWPLRNVRILVLAERMRLVGILNYVALQNVKDYSFIGFMGDDHMPKTWQWDQELREGLEDAGNIGLAYGNDLLQGELMPTMVLMSSDIIETLGYMVPPNLEHLCADLVWKDWGQGIDRLVYCPATIIEHMHPANEKAPLDALYETNNSAQQVEQDSQAYYEYRDTQLSQDVAKLKALIA